MTEKDDVSTEIVSVGENLELASQNLMSNTEQLAVDIITEDNPEKMTDLVALFNLAHAKKAVLRTLSYDQLMDAVTAQMKERITKRADQFSHKDLLDYLNTTSAAMEKAQKTFTTVDTAPVIQFNQQNNTVIVHDELSRESKQKVTDAVKSILEKLKHSDVSEVIEDENPVLDNEQDISDNVEITEVVTTAEEFETTSETPVEE